MQEAVDLLLPRLPILEYALTNASRALIVALLDQLIQVIHSQLLQSHSKKSLDKPQPPPKSCSPLINK